MPNHITKKDKVNSSSNAVSKDGFNQHLTKTMYDIKTVSLNEFPDFVFWKKRNYEIQLWLDYKNKTSKIIFKT